MKKLNIKKIIIASVVSIFAVYFVTVGIRAIQLRKNSVVAPLTLQQQTELNDFLNNNYSEQNEILTQLPYTTIPAKLDIGAESAIVINMANGNILYEKNPDEIIPPASMTKIAVMYVVFQEIKKGTVSLKDIVPLPENTWACNMPPHSSLMFLGKNQTVTLEELLLGLAVCSGNDASYAIAEYICGGMEPFIQRMNDEVKALGLKNTHFIETSAYSELNTTTAREMATLSRVYIKEFPESLKKFHSALSFSYPKEHNLAPEDKGKPRAQDFSQGLPENITMEIYQKNTNPLLGKLSGCDGLKTGYIDESGYNLALTAVRNGMRILSVTMKGPGNNTQEGQAGRVKDGTTIMEWAYSTFAEYKNPFLLRTYNIPLACAKSERLPLIPAYKPESLLIPLSLVNNKTDLSKEINVHIELPKLVRGKVDLGKEYGYIEYKIGDVCLEKIPLIAQRTIKQSNPFIYLADLIAQVAFYF